jgi:hypothetical protein
MTAHQTPAQRLTAADEAQEELRAALDACGIKLPSLRVDPASAAGPAPRPLINLGCCNPSTARKLAAALRGNVQGTEAER